jgi:alpha-L-fucosidase
MPSLLRQFSLTLVCLLLLMPIQAQQPTAPRPKAETIREWQSRKYGMFIHFGLYSELGGVWKGKQYSGNYSEQIQSDAHIPEAEYSALAAKFNPTKWDPEAIVKLAQDAGMKFIVLTAKHHDGFSLFHTRQSSFNSVEASPYKQDIVKSLAEACARHHMPFGVYYSTIDWHFGDVPSQMNDNPISKKHEEFNVAQIHELMSGYGPLSEIWFDMGHPTQIQSQSFSNAVHGVQPETMIGGRIWNNEGDFSETGDDAIPDYIQTEPWQSPASIFSETWGYRSWQKRTDVQEKIHEELLRLVKVVSRGGNYILNIGPMGDGSVVPYEADVLRGTGKWLQQNGEAIYDTQPQPFRKLDFGFSTVKGNRLYLFVERLPENGKLELPGLQNVIEKASWLNRSTASELKFENSADNKSLLASKLPTDGFLPVAVVDFKGPLQVLFATTKPNDRDVITLLPDDCEKFYNLNGEGYYDPPTIQRELWHFAVNRPGRYRVELNYKPGRFARLFNVQIAGDTLNALVYGEHKEAAQAGVVNLEKSADLTLSVFRATPAERASVIDVEFTSITLSYLGPQ